MKTLFAIIMLVVATLIAGFVTVLALNTAGLPGAIFAGKPGTRTKGQFVFGSIVSAVGQSFIYLAYTIFIVNWTRLAITHQQISVFIWLGAFLAVVVPLWTTLIRARLEDRETQHANPQVEALHITFLVTLIAFFVFAFFPTVGTTTYSWVPYVKLPAGI